MPIPAHVYTGVRSTLKKGIFLTYSDTLADVSLVDLFRFIKSQKTLNTHRCYSTIQEGEFIVEDNLAVVPTMPAKMPNKSFSVSSMAVIWWQIQNFSYLTSFSECRLESEVFTRLMNEKQLALFGHHGFWRWLDTDRDYLYLQELVDKNKMYWLQKQERGDKNERRKKSRYDCR